MAASRWYKIALIGLGLIVLAACGTVVPPEAPPEPPTAVTRSVPPRQTQVQATAPARLALAFVTPTPTATLKPTARPTANGMNGGGFETGPDDLSPENRAKRNALPPTPVPQYQFLLPPIDLARLAGLAIPPRNIVTADNHTRKIALTFDTGAGSPIVRLVLAELQELKAPATFFIVGNWAEKNQDLVLQIAAAGHDLANHSYNHPNFTTLSEEQMIAQLVVTDDIVQRVTGCSTRPFFRAPFGALNPTVLRTLGQAGFESIFWSAHGGDWLPGISMESVRDTTLRLSGNGGIIVLHSSVPETAQAVPSIVQELRARGFELVRLSELLTTDPAQPHRAPCRPRP